MDAGLGCAVACDDVSLASVFGTWLMFDKLGVEATFVIKLLVVNGASKVTPDEYGE